MADEKKIIIDEDWKSQVQAEKEAAAKSAAAARPESPAQPSGAGGHMPIPPASLEMLLTMLATEAMVALGQIAHPATGQPQPDLGQAQYLIDLVEVLREKTQGNLSANEQQLMETLLHQLRLAYVESAGDRAPGPSPDHLA